MNRECARKRKDNIVAMLVIALAMLFAKLWSVFIVKLPWISDEAGVWQTTEYLLGYGESWKSYLNIKVTGFYGIITSIIYLPIFIFFEDPVVVYRLCLIINIFMLIVASYLAFKIMYELLGVSWDVSLLYALAAVILYSVLFSANMILTETVFTVWVWMVMYVFLYFSKKKRTNIINTLELAFLLATGYLIHSRCLIIYALFALILLSYKLIYKKWYINPVLFICTFGILIFLFSQISNNIQSYFWNTNLTGNSVENRASDVFLILDVLLSDFRGMIKTFISLLEAFTVETCGVVAGCIYISICYINYILHNFKCIYKDKVVVLAFLFSFGCFWGMNLCLAFMEHAPSRSRWYVYTRYATPFLGQYIMVCLYLLNKLKYNGKKMVLFIILYMSIAIKWMTVNWPVLLNDSQTGRFDSAWFFCYKLISVVNEFGINLWIVFCGLFIIISFDLTFYMLYKKREKCCAVVTIVSALILYIISNFSYATPMEFSTRYWESTDAIWECLNKCDFKKYKICCMGSSGFYLPAQINLSKYDVTFIEKFDEIKDEDTLYFSDLFIEEKISEYVFELDEEEYLYTSNQGLCSLLSKEYIRIR